ncbi:hypothetical protein AB0284_05940 [Pseudarthrobacter phenanthrenivorans]|uniref:beta strand repeat-containing protein n=1 Tax=Pseudarthrobacter phenanthrenivorans TaxID=361575 RepID=UPI003450095E
MSLAIRKMPLGLRVPSGRLAWTVTALLLLLGTATAAYGFWASTTSSSNAAAAADTLSPGSKPSVTASGASLSVSWAAGTTVNGRAATGYTVTRYATDTGGTGAAATGGCAGTVTTLTCTEQNVPGGIWYYTITPTIALWTGTESPRSTGVSNDSTAPITSVSGLSPTPNAAGWNNTSPVTVTITGDDGPGGSGVASISYKLDTGVWQTVSGASATVTVSGDGTHTVSYFATDKVGNIGTTQTQTVKIDTQAPAAPVLSVAAFVNSSRVASAPVTGTTEANATITLTASDAGAAHSAPPVTTTADSAGNWAASIDLSSLNQGTVTYSAVATDAAGNVGPAGKTTNTKDTVAPAAAQAVKVPTYINNAGTQTANSANATSVPVSGTAEVNGSVTVTATDSASHSVSGTAVASGSTGAWSLNLNLGSASAMVDGTITYTITLTDPAGNTGSAVTPSPTSTRDIVAPRLTIDTPNYIYSGNVGNYQISGTTDSGAPVNVIVSDSTTNLSASASGSPWTASGLNMSSLKETSTTVPVVAITASASTIDAAGNSTTATVTLIKDTVGPKVIGISMANKSGSAGKSDTLSITYSEPMNPAMFCPKWDGSSLDGTATIANGSDIANDTLSFTGTGCTVPNIGSIWLGGDYVGTTSAIFGSNGTASSLSLDPTNKTLTIKLGNAPTGQGILKAGVPIGTPKYGFAPTLTDVAGNTLGDGTFTTAVTDKSGF